ncbi:MAG: glycosyltransferase family protein [Magnetococcales bacterium]|nr:glycosyltransferase family protein [Magnetococcales bacterium]
MSTTLHAQLAQVAEAVGLARWQEAAHLLQPLRAAHPSHPRILHLWGVILQETGDLQGALTAMSQAAAIQPDDATLHLALGLLLKKKGALAPAMERLQESLTLDPGRAETHFHLGDLHMDRGEADEAAQRFQEATRRQPGFTEAWINLALCRKAQKAIPEAMACLREAIRLRPDNAMAHVNLAMTHLMLGEYAQGWREYEWRFRLDENCLPMDLPGVPRWRGEPLEGKSVALLAEQGYGDILQFIRFAPELKARGARVLLSAPTPLLTLLQRAPGVDQACNHTRFDATPDYRIPLLSLPEPLAIDGTNLARAGGYLTPEPQAAAMWHERLAGPGRKVGLIWEGKPLHKNDPLRRRSCALAELAPLAAVPGVRLIGLQKGEAAWRTVPAGMEILSLEAELTDFTATAAIMATLDLIITIDTASAHLAGALGKTVWTLLPLAPDWRWGIEGDATPWYDTMRLFRQHHPNRWDEPIREMAQALEKTT